DDPLANRFLGKLARFLRSLLHAVVAHGAPANATSGPPPPFDQRAFLPILVYTRCSPSSRQMIPHPRFLTAAFAVVIAAATASEAPAQGVVSRAAEPIARELALVTFDSAWRRIGATYYDTAMRGVDWNAVRDSLRP